MNITIEISMYPLREDYKIKILDFLKIISKHDGIQMKVNALSTQLQGESNLLFDAIRDAISEVFAENTRASFVMKVLPGDIDLDYSYKA